MQVRYGMAKKIGDFRRKALSSELVRKFVRLSVHLDVRRGAAHRGS